MLLTMAVLQFRCKILKCAFIFCGAVHKGYANFKLEVKSMTIQIQTRVQTVFRYYTVCYVRERPYFSPTVS